MNSCNGPQLWIQYGSILICKNMVLVTRGGEERFTLPVIDLKTNLLFVNGDVQLCYS